MISSEVITIIFPESLKKSSEKINIINIDYLFSTNPRRIYPKRYRNYHDEEMLLLIVLLISKLNNYSIPLDVPYKENIRIIEINNFFKILPFDISFEKKIRHTIELAKKAPYIPTAYGVI